MLTDGPSARLRQLGHVSFLIQSEIPLAASKPPMKEHNNPKVIVAEDGDILITQGLDQPVLFISRFLVPSWLSKPDLARPKRLSCPVAAALFAIAAEADAVLLVLRDNPPPTATPIDLCFSILFGNGLHAGYFSNQTIIINDASWLRRHGFDLAVGPNGFVARTNPNPIMEVVIPQGQQAPAASSPGKNDLPPPAFSADELAHAVRAALKQQYNTNEP